MLFLRRRSRVAVKPEALPESVGQKTEGLQELNSSAIPESPYSSGLLHRPSEYALPHPKHFIRSPSWKMFEKIELRKNI
jgi:hypothetical protein